MAPPRTPPIRWCALTAVLVFFHLLQPSISIYCDEDDCYDLLGVSQTANASEIKKAYYKLSLKYHPDKNPDPESKKLFVKIANAYEILKDDTTREQYDYAIAHPEEVFYNTARYYRAYYGHKTDPRAVLVGLLLVLSAFQYLNQWTRYKQALDMVKKTPAYKNKLKALELERTGGLTSRKKSNKQTNKKLEEELSKELELQIKGAEKPSVWALLGIRFILLPYTLGKILLWYGGWFWRYKVKQAPYSWEDASYLTRRSLGVSSDSWQYVGKQKSILLFLNLEMLLVLFVLLGVTDPALGKSEEDQYVLAIPQKENYGSKEPSGDLGIDIQSTNDNIDKTCYTISFYPLIQPMHLIYR